MRSSHRGETGVPGHGDGDPECAAPSFAAERIEAYSAMAPVDDDRHEHLQAAAPRRTDQCGGVRLPVEGQVQRIRLPALNIGNPATALPAKLERRI